jgi:hypothetical protein
MPRPIWVTLLILSTAPLCSMHIVRADDPAPSGQWGHVEGEGSGARWVGDMCHSPGATALMEHALNQPGAATLVVRDISTKLYDEKALPGQVSLVCHVTGVLKRSQSVDGKLVSGTFTMKAGTGHGLWDSAVQWVADDECDRPPYGGTVAEYKAFVEVFGKLLDKPANVLTATCKLKFAGADRTPLYNLGFTDADIDIKSTADLAVAELNAMRKRLRNE